MKKLNEKEAKLSEKVYRNCNWDVVANHTQLGWELRGKASDGNGHLSAFTHNDMKSFIILGMVSKIK